MEPLLQNHSKLSRIIDNFGISKNIGLEEEKYK